MNPGHIKKKIEEHNIRWIQLHFTDLFGRLRALHVSAEQFLEDTIWKNGIGFDGSSVGFSDVEKSDMTAIPDPSSFLILPHEEGEARVVADIRETPQKKFNGDPRTILKRALTIAARQGFDMVAISPEMEFYLLDEHTGTSQGINKKKGYFVPPPLDDAKEYRKELSELLIKSGYTVKYHHHETGKNQHEVEVFRLNAVGAADFCIYFKYLARELAFTYDLKITFMPKPFSNDAGNGMHAHIALYKKGVNTFYDKDDEYNLSQTARYFIGGILEHARGIAAIANPTVNSYKRLIPNFEAPIYVAWAKRNRSSLIRIPARKNIDMEIRNADPAANPYFLYAAFIHAGLDGIKKKIVYEPVEKNIYGMSAEELKHLNIERLPTNLMEALEELEKDTVIKKAIGKETAELFIDKKTREWNEYMTEVTDSDYLFYFNC